MAKGYKTRGYGQGGFQQKAVLALLEAFEIRKKYGQRGANLSSSLVQMVSAFHAAPSWCKWVVQYMQHPS